MAPAKKTNATLLACYLLLFVVCGCGSDPWARVAASGTVTVDGEPLRSGTIIFIPAEGETGPKAIGAVIDGVFDMDREDGPVAGRMLIEIWAPTSQQQPPQHAGGQHGEAIVAEVLPEMMLSPEKDGQSTLDCETTKQGPNEFDFDIQTAH